MLPGACWTLLGLDGEGTMWLVAAWLLQCPAWLTAQLRQKRCPHLHTSTVGTRAACRTVPGRVPVYAACLEKNGDVVRGVETGWAVSGGLHWGVSGMQLTSCHACALAAVV